MSWLRGNVRGIGQATARNRWDRQLFQQCDGWNGNSWQQTEALRDTLWQAGVTLRAGTAQWTHGEVQIVAEAVRRIAHRFDDDAHPIIGGVTIILNTKVEPWWAPLWRLWHRKPRNYRFGAYENRGKVYLCAGHVHLAGIVHELGHYFDERLGLSRRYLEELRRADGFRLRTNRYEDFATAFQRYVLETPHWPSPESPADVARCDYFDRFRSSILT